MLYLTSPKGSAAPLQVAVSEFMVKMRDGVSLFTYVLHRADAQKCPVVFVRTPYEAFDRNFQAHCDADYALLNAGYAMVKQHCRGCGGSEGECIPYDFERNDGLDSLDWIRSQPFYNGEIYLLGGSYLTSVHWSYLDTAPADVKGAILAIQEVERYNILYRNGFFKCGLHGSWFVGMYKKKSLLKKNFTSDSFRTLPITNFPRAVFGEEVPAFSEPLKHPDRSDPFWETPAGGSDYRHALEKLRIPVLLITGFFDLYTEGIFQMWDDIPAENRANCALVVTPYDHSYTGEGQTVVKFEKGALNDVWGERELNWFNSIRLGEPLRFVTRGMITWYDVFGGQWHTAPRLPEGPKQMKLYLRSDAALGSTPASAAALHYCYNPFNPADFKGGCCNNFGGMQIQDPPGYRRDILNFISAPSAEERMVRGASDLTLCVSSDCPDSCFYARLSLVREGIAYGMRDDIVSLRGQHPDYVPGSEVELKLRFAPIAFRLGVGDRLRLDVSSSCWPYFLAHTNRAGAFWEQTGADLADNAVICSKSYLTLCADGEFAAQSCALEM